MLRSSILMLVVWAVAACGPKGQQTGQGTADSTVTGSASTDSAAARDSIGPSPDTDTAPALRESVPSKSASKAPGAEAYIGRDSAFGPTFTVDSTGKVTPIVPSKKKP